MVALYMTTRVGSSRRRPHASSTSRPKITKKKVSRGKVSPPVPEEIKTLPQQNATTARATLRRLARSKPAWYAVVMLAMGGASLVVVRRSMTNAHLRGLGEATIKALRRLGHTLHIPAMRRAYWKDRANDLVSRVGRGDMSGAAAMREYGKAFAPTDDIVVVKKFLNLFEDKIKPLEKKWWRFL